MAFDPNQGMNWKVTGEVDSSFTQSVQQAREGIAKSAQDSKAWKQSLQELSQALGGSDKSVRDLVNSTRSLGDAVKIDWSKISRDMDGAASSTEKLTKATSESTKATREAAAAQKELEKAQQKNIMVGVRLFEGFAGGIAGLRRASSSGIAGLIQEVSGIHIPFMAVSAAIEVAKHALDSYAESEQQIGEKMAAESRSLAKVTQDWHEYGNAIARADGNRAGFGFSGRMPGGGEFDRRALTAMMDAVRGKISGMSPLQAYASLENNALKDPLKAENAQRLADISKARTNVGQSIPALRGLRAYFSGVDPSHKLTFRQGQVSDEMARALGKTEALQQFGQVSITSGELEQAIRAQDKLYAQLSQGKTAAEEYAKKIDGVAKSLDEMAQRRQRVQELNSSLKSFAQMRLADYEESGDRGDLQSGHQLMERARNINSANLQANAAAYRKLTGNKSTPAALAATVANQYAPKEFREQANKLLQEHLKLQESQKALRDYDIQANQRIIGQMEQQLELRKALNQSSPQDELNTINAELGVVGKGDVRTRTRLLGRRSAVQKQIAEDSFRNTIDDLRNSYHELASDGTATASQLEQQNQKVAAAAEKWKRENAAILEQFPKLREEVDKILAGTRAETGRNRKRGYEENFLALTTEIGGKEDAALNTRDRAKAVEESIGLVHSKLEKGLITQKQATEELNKLEKERANIQRTISKEMDAQQRAVTNLKAGLASDRLKRLDKAVSEGHGGLTARHDREQLVQQELRAKLDAIDEEFQAAVKARKDQTLAAEEASLKKQRLYENEANKFAEMEDRKTSAQKAADKERLGGSASPLVGLNEGVSFSGVNFSGFAKFGDHFGKSALHDYRSPFDPYGQNTMPDYAKAQFQKHQSFEGLPAGGGSNVTNVNLTLGTMPPDVQALARQMGQRVAEHTRQHAEVVGTGAPQMTRSNDFGNLCTGFGP